MSSVSDESVVIHLLGRDYHIRCPEAERHALEAAAVEVNARMQKLHHASPSTNTEHVAVVTALNICHEWLQLKQHDSGEISAINQTLSDLSEEVKKVLSKHEEILV